MAFPVAVQARLELEREIVRLNRDPRFVSRRGPFHQRVTQHGNVCVACVVDRHGRRVKQVDAIKYSAFAP